jgi:predicted nucleic acid-binding protein
MLNCPIWSEDKQLKKQAAVEVLTTPELLVRLGVK